MKKKETKEFIMRKFHEKWIKENKGMMEDYYKICHDILMFKAMWGIGIGIIFKTPAKEEKGRQLGKGITDELFSSNFPMK